MATQEVILTPEGHAKLKEELAWREGERAKEITEAIRRAKEFGDLSENAEYDAARDDQAHNEARIAELNAVLANARVVEATDASTVSIGCSVTVDDGAHEPVTFVIVGTTETNSLEHKISNESPLGAALMGHRVGDTCEMRMPNGRTTTYSIISIER